MTARPGQKDDRSRWTQVIGDLAELFAQVILLITAGKRTPEMVQALRSAVQAVKDNTLSGITHKVTLVDNLQAVLSLLVSETEMPDHLKKYLSQRGVRYIGEIYRLFWDKRGAKVQEIRTELFIFLKGSFGLSEFVDLETVWRPPYWDDPSFIAALNRPIGQAVVDRNRTISWDFSRRQERDPQDVRWYLTTSNRWQHAQGIHYAGQWLFRRDFGVGKMKDKQSMLLPNSGLWAAAFLPPEWTAPTEISEEWTRELAVIEREKKFASERARLRAAEIKDRAAKQLQPTIAVPLPASPQQGDFLHRMLNDQEYLEVLFRPVDQLEDSCRLANCLENQKITFVGEILLYSDAEKLKWKNFGRKILKELKEIIQPLLGVWHDSIPAPQLEVLRRALQLRREGRGIDEILTTVREQFQL